MKRISINKQTVYVPESWDDITLGFYETWFDKIPANNRERVELTAEICRITPELLYSASPALFNRIAATLSFLFEESLPVASPVIEVKKMKFFAPVNEELTLAQWVDADEIQRGSEKNLSGILAVVCLRQGEKYDPVRFDERQQMFASLKMSKVLGMIGFFLLCKNSSGQLSQICSDLRENTERFLTDTKSSHRAGGGTRLSRTWQKIGFSLSILWLHYRLCRFLPSSATKPKSTKPKRPNDNLRNN